MPLLATTTGAAILSIASEKHVPKPPLENFYVVTQASFHSGAKWVDHILEVSPQGDDVLVREIRIAPLDKDCPRHVTVRAVERVLPNTTVKKLTVKFPICAFEEDVVEGMISVVKREGRLSVTDDAASVRHSSARSARDPASRLQAIGTSTARSTLTTPPSARHG